jgi:hypothetical protein
MVHDSYGAGRMDASGAVQDNGRRVVVRGIVVLD